MELLIIRADIVSLILLVSFSLYYFLGEIKDREQRLFLRLSQYAIAHVILSMITVYTVNNMDVVPAMVNRVAHVLFYLTGLLSHVELFKYVLRMSFPHKSYKSYRLWQIFIYVPVIIYTISTFFIPVEYCKGEGTYYSYGPLVFIAYGISVVMSIICVMTYLIRWKYIKLEVKCTVVPMSIIMLVIVIIQAFKPELLLTSAGLSLVCIGVFFTLDNPIEVLKEQAYFDKETKVKNRNCYENDLKYYVENYKNLDMYFGAVIADVNYLKMVNDNYGHFEGDRVIRATAKTLKTFMKNAEEVYRIGGDEFIAIYIDVEDEVMRQDIENFNMACKKVTNLPVELSVAVGYTCDNLNVTDIEMLVKIADENMYKNKAKMHDRK